MVLRFTRGVLISVGAPPLDDDLVISGFRASLDPYNSTFSNLHFCEHSCGHPSFVAKGNLILPTSVLEYQEMFVT